MEWGDLFCCVVVPLFLSSSSALRARSLLESVGSSLFRWRRPTLWPARWRARAWRATGEGLGVQSPSVGVLRLIVKWPVGFMVPWAFFMEIFDLLASCYPFSASFGRPLWFWLRVNDYGSPLSGSRAETAWRCCSNSRWMVNYWGFYDRGGLYFGPFLCAFLLSSRFL